MQKTALRMMTSIGVLMIAVIARADTVTSLTLKSPVIMAGEKLDINQVYRGFGCRGANLSPELRWQGAPAGTQSFAVTMFDPDAPTGSGWWHWVVVNLPANTMALPGGAGREGDAALPSGALQTRTDFGQVGFGGACPPEGDKPHRYVLTLWALKVPKLEVSADTPAAMVSYMIRANALASTHLEAWYQR